MGNSFGLSPTKEDLEQFNILDVLKFIMAIVVVSIHTHPLEHSTIEWAQSLLTIVQGAAVPFFFCASGFLLYCSIGTLSNSDGVLRFLKRAVTLYVIWTAIYMPLAIYGSLINNPPPLVDFFIVLRGIFLIGENFNSWPLWYLLSLIYSFLLILWASKKERPLRLLGISSIILFALPVLVSVLYANLQYMWAPIEYAVRLFRILFANGAIFIGPLYVTAGLLIAKYRPTVPKLLSTIILCLMLVLRIVLPESIGSLFVFGYAVAFFLIVYSMKLKNRPIYRYLRKSSTVIYFTHMLVYSLFCIVILKVSKHFGIDSFLITVIGTITLSILVIWLEKFRAFFWLKKIL